MEIIGRITKNATVSETKAGKKVVNFSIAINDTYKSKDSSEVQKLVTYVNCSYWINPGVAALLNKETVVECTGRIGVNAWTDKNGEARASLTFHVNNIKLHGGAKSNIDTTAAPVITTPAAMAEATDDLPF
ncbi:MAG: single-stranded DNA-binding protein [Bacteroidetes bacterium]|nr:single-stranded DNA-binding protein [Bacteroidota bacterium]